MAGKLFIQMFTLLIVLLLRFMNTMQFFMLSFLFYRVIKYDPQSKKKTVLAEGLLFANGIALSSDEDFLVFAESVGARLTR